MAKRSPGISDIEIPERLRYMRQRRDITQTELAKKSGISQSTIAQIESGRKDPSISTLKKIAAALDIEVAILFAKDDVHVFDMKRLRKRYKSIDDLNPTLYMALDKVIRYAREIGFIE